VQDSYRRQVPRLAPRRAKASGLALILVGATAVAAATEFPTGHTTWIASGREHFTTGTLSGLTIAGDDLLLPPRSERARGLFTSAPRHLPGGFDAVLLGLRASALDRHHVRVQARAIDPRGRRTRWADVRPEGELTFGRTFTSLQYRVQLTRMASGESPRFQGISATWSRRAHSGDDGGGGEAPPPPTAATPEIVSRSDWGARPPRAAYTRHRVRFLTVHHTVVPTSGQYQGARTIRGIQSSHMNSNGWNDIGYHYVIGPDGSIFAGRPPGVVGAHATPNTGNVGVCLVGNFEGPDSVTPEARAALASLLRWLAGRYGVPTRDVRGHRDLNSTACPGRRLYALLPEIRREIDETDRANVDLSPCDFYQDTLEARAPCGAAGYAAGYGGPYCRRFLSRIGSFSPRGARWMRGALVCLQDYLRGVLERPGGPPDCGEMHQLAFDSHPACYTESEVSFCDLTPRDYLEVGRIIALRDQLSPEGRRQILGVARTCLERRRAGLARAVGGRPAQAPGAPRGSGEREVVAALEALVSMGEAASHQPSSPP
jgi:hypothetical protein